MLKVNVLVAFLVLGIVGPSLGIDKSKWPKLVCRSNGFYGPTIEMLLVASKCGIKDPTARCSYFCQAKEFGLDNEEGLVTLDTLEEFIDESLPSEHRVKAKEHAKNCYENYGQYIQPDDEDCTNANAFTKCVWTTLSMLTCTPNI